MNANGRSTAEPVRVSAKPVPTVAQSPFVSTQTLEKPSTSDADTGDEVFHYVRKAKIAESAVMGTMVQALCGEIFPVTKTPKKGAPVCPQCKEIYESMPA
jgi:hypothetical protein